MGTFQIPQHYTGLILETSWQGETFLEQKSRRCYIDGSVAFSHSLFIIKKNLPTSVRLLGEGLIERPGP